MHDRLSNCSTDCTNHHCLDISHLIYWRRHRMIAILICICTRRVIPYFRWNFMNRLVFIHKNYFMWWWFPTKWTRYWNWLQWRQWCGIRRYYQPTKYKTRTKQETVHHHSSSIDARQQRWQWLDHFSIFFYNLTIREFWFGPFFCCLLHKQQHWENEQLTES